MKSVAKGEIVEFDVIMGSKNLPEAANVTVLNNKPVRGSRYAANSRKDKLIEFISKLLFLQQSNINLSKKNSENSRRKIAVIINNQNNKKYDSEPKHQVPPTQLKSYKQN